MSVSEWSASVWVRARMHFEWMWERVRVCVCLCMSVSKSESTWMRYVCVTETMYTSLSLFKQTHSWWERESHNPATTPAGKETIPPSSHTTQLCAAVGWLTDVVKFIKRFVSILWRVEVWPIQLTSDINARQYRGTDRERLWIRHWIMEEKKREKGGRRKRIKKERGMEARRQRRKNSFTVLLVSVIGLRQSL